MNIPDNHQPQTRAAWYEIRVQGHLEQRWAVRFDAMTLTTEDGGTTCITGAVADQAALQGQLRQISDLGLSLLSVRRVDPPHHHHHHHQATTTHTKEQS
jgi:hypothetical protein